MIDDYRARVTNLSKTVIIFDKYERCMNTPFPISLEYPGPHTLQLSFGPTLVEHIKGE